MVICYSSYHSAITLETLRAQMNLELKTVSVMVLPSVYTVARGSDGPSKEGSSKSCKWMIPSLRLRLLFVSGTFRRNFFFSFPTENLSWVLLQKTIPLSLLLVPPQGPQQLLTNVFLSPSENTEIVGSLTWLTCLSHKDSASIFKFPVSNWVDFVCQSGKHRSEYFIHNQNSVPRQSNYRG